MRHRLPGAADGARQIALFRGGRTVIGVRSSAFHTNLFATAPLHHSAAIDVRQCLRAFEQEGI